MYDFFQYLPNYLSAYDDFIILAGLAVALSGAIAIVMLKQETQKSKRFAWILRWQSISSHPFNHGGNALPQTDTHGGKSDLGVLLLHDIKQGSGDSRSRAAKRMP